MVVRTPGQDDRIVLAAGEKESNRIRKWVLLPSEFTQQIISKRQEVFFIYSFKRNFSAPCVSVFTSKAISGQASRTVAGTEIQTCRNS